MSSYREKLDKGICGYRKHSGFRKWAKRQMSKIRRRWPKDEEPPKTNRLTRGYYS